jgi:hypothetical protein
MARVLDFFPRQMLCGQTGAASDYYSQIFEVSSDATIVAEFRIYANSSASTIAAIIQECADPNLTEWSTLVTFTSLASGSNKQTPTNPLRFVRAKITVPSATPAIAVSLALLAVAREP